MKGACMRAGKESFTPHHLRHFYVTEMLRNGASWRWSGGYWGTRASASRRTYTGMSPGGEMHEEHSRHAPMNGVKG